MPYQLIQETISPDTVEALTQLLASARRGDIVGIAFALILKRRRILVDCAGEACDNPVLARGAVTVLSDHLSDLIRGRTDQNTTI